MKWLLVAGLMMWSSWAQSQPLSAFISGSMQQIVEAQRGKPFVLMFWSLDCTHCQHDLRQWGKLSQGKPAPVLVLVAVDGPERQAAIRARLQQYRLTSQAAWVFADMPRKSCALKSTGAGMANCRALISIALMASIRRSAASWSHSSCRTGCAK
jgi:thiol-disulfide isomerase/thioredoxin